MPYKYIDYSTYKKVAWSRKSLFFLVVRFNKKEFNKLVGIYIDNKPNRPKVWHGFKRISDFSNLTFCVR